MKPYRHEFYLSRHQKTVYSAEAILSLLLEVMPPVNSAIDVGCGVGTWLSVLLTEKNVEQVKGIDGEWVDLDLLEIPRESFLQMDLSQPIELPDRYDLAISLEVAEHLPPESAETFVTSLTQLSDFVLFSAAIPFQGGRNHLNEQWHDYWAELFQAYGYLPLDFVRKKMWHDEKILTWYRQNILFYVKKDRIKDLKNNSPEETTFPLSVVHPDAYLIKMRQTDSVGGSFKIFSRALKKWVK